MSNDVITFIKNEKRSITNADSMSYNDAINFLKSEKYRDKFYNEATILDVTNLISMVQFIFQRYENSKEISSLFDSMYAITNRYVERFKFDLIYDFHCISKQIYYGACEKELFWGVYESGTVFTFTYLDFKKRLDVKHLFKKYVIDMNKLKLEEI